VVLCAAAGCWAFNVGLCAPLASLWLQGAGWSDTIIGLNTATYYLSVAGASLFVPRLLARGSRTCVAIGLAGSGLTAALFPWADSLPGWFLLRALNGCAGALTLIPLETLVNLHAPPERRARFFGVFEFCIAAGAGLGALIGLQVYALAPRFAFASAGLVALAATILVAPALPGDQAAEEKGENGGPISLRPHFLSFGTAWSQGFLEGGLIAFLSLYLLGLGYSESGAGWLVGSLLLGVVLFQVPVTWLADRLGRGKMVLACHAAVLTSLAILPFCTGATGLAFWLFWLGACCGAQYPVALAALGERLPSTFQARANALFLACNCAGSLAGPVLTGMAMDRWGSRALFVAGVAATLVVLGVWALWGWERGERGGERRSGSPEEKDKMAA
jgi:MFS family permease